MHEQYEDCDFCVELNGGSTDLFSKLSTRVKFARRISQFGNIAVFPCLGEMVSGHLLIAPNYHVTSALRIDDSDRSDFYEALDVTTLVLRQASGHNPIFFEHGDPTGVEFVYGQCISHAHVHALPGGVDMFHAIQQQCRHIATSDIRSAALQISEPYIMVSTDLRKAHFFAANDLPRQYLRKVYANAIQAPSAWDWFANIDIDVTLRSAEIYRSLFNEVRNDRAK